MLNRCFENQFGKHVERSLRVIVKIVEIMANCHHLHIFSFKIVPLVTENEHPISLLMAVVFRQCVEIED